MPKIAIIGSRHVVFTRRLVGDLPSSPALEGSHLSLMDVDEQRLALIGRLVEKMVRDSGVTATWTPRWTGDEPYTAPTTSSPPSEWETVHEEEWS